MFGEFHRCILRWMTLDGHNYRGAISAINSLFVVCVVEISGPPNVNSFAVLIYLLKDCAGDIRTAQIESISGPDNIRRFFSHCRATVAPSSNSLFPHKYIPAPASVGWYISKNDRLHHFQSPHISYFIHFITILIESSLSPLIIPCMDFVGKNINPAFSSSISIFHVDAF